MLERRQYVRMGTVFPVEVQVFEEAGGKSSHLLQGFTRDVSLGGLCVELKSFGKETEKLFVPNARLGLTINPTFARNPIPASGRIAWLEKSEEFHPSCYRLGVAYTQIDETAKRRIVRHAQWLEWTPRLVLAVVFVMVIVLGGLTAHNRWLVRENKSLVNQLVENAAKKSEVASGLYQIQEKKTLLDRELAKAQSKISRLEKSLASATQQNIRRRQIYQKELSYALKKRQIIGLQLKTAQEGKEKLKVSYDILEESGRPIAATTLRQMVDWLKTHRNLHTGLVASFEGDASLEDWAFTYDQALACQIFLLFDDAKSAREILSFFDTRTGNDYFNAYDTVDGSPKENVMRAGPNIWIGLAALQYQHRLKDGLFLPLARRVADAMIAQQDAEGGVRGGPDVRWYSTEHNLDAYAFFSMLYQETGEDEYRAAADRVLKWIKKYAYSMKEKRMQRGKGDATIATDTFSWAVAAIGPAKLREMGWDPEEIMRYAEEHCEVTVSFKQPNGKIAKARGFDFAKVGHVGRGGIISTEWTAQMIVAYQILADYFESRQDSSKAVLYRDKSNFYLNELQKLVITSPSRTGQGRGCLPYASIDNADTGHGWRTPRGERTGSVAATAYGIFAWVGYNPFSLENKITIDKDE